MLAILPAFFAIAGGATLALRFARFFRILRLYLTYFRGQPGSSLQLMGVAPEPKSEAWGALLDALGPVGAAVGARVSTAAGVPPLAGQVEHVGPSEFPEELLLRLDQPAPGLAHLFAMPMAGQVVLPIRVYLYGDRAPEEVARQEPVWQAWLGAHFPAAGEAGQSE